MDVCLLCAGGPGRQHHFSLWSAFVIARCITYSMSEPLVPNVGQLPRAFAAVALMCCSSNAICLLVLVPQRLALFLSGLGRPPSVSLPLMAGMAVVFDLTSRNASHEMKNLRSELTPTNPSLAHSRTVLTPQSRDRNQQSASMDDGAWSFQAGLEVIPAAIAR